MNKKTPTLAIFGASLVRLCVQVDELAAQLKTALADIDMLKQKIAEIGTDTNKATTKRKKKVVV